MLPSRLVARLTLALVLLLGLPVGAPAGAATPPPGAAGVGDPYFPLDGNGGIDVLSYDVHDRYQFGPRVLSGWTRLRVRATQTVSSFDLDFLLPVSSVRVQGARARFAQRPHELVVHRGLRAGQVVSVLVAYAGRPGRASYLGESNWLADRHEVVAMNQPHMAPWWFPANDHPLDKARMRISITVPRRVQVIANGARLRRAVHGRLATTTWAAAEPMAPYLAFFAAGRFRVAQGVDAGLPWSVAVSRRLPTGSQTSSMALMRRTPALVRWLESDLGSYPFSTVGGLTTVLDPGFALENQTRPTYTAMGDGPGAVDTVVHELAHQWFGDSVALAAWRDIWLNEGAATFMEWRYDETHGGEAAQQELLDYYDRAADDPFWQREVADPCPDHRACVGKIFDARVYERGAMTLQALRNRVGDAAFWQILRTWTSARAGGHGSTADFESLAARVSGLDLSGFFQAWLHAGTKPSATADNGLA